MQLNASERAHNAGVVVRAFIATRGRRGGCYFRARSRLPASRVNTPKKKKAGESEKKRVPVCGCAGCGVRSRGKKQAKMQSQGSGIPLPVLPTESFNPTPMMPVTAGNRWKTWQSDEDIPQRKILIQHM